MAFYAVRDTILDQGELVVQNILPKTTIYPFVFFDLYFPEESTRSTAHAESTPDF